MADTPATSDKPGTPDASGTPGILAASNAVVNPARQAAREFQLVSEHEPMGDQPSAIAELVDGVHEGRRYQTLLGATGTGKTFTMANVIAQVQKPTLVISHNKTLAAQLYEEFKELFPNNAVCYFVSYYDYYQPEAYIPQRDIYIEKDASRNDDLDRLRLYATSSLISRGDVIVVASVSCIFGLGSPDAYKSRVLSLSVGQSFNRRDLMRALTDMQYSRNEYDLKRGVFRVRGEVIEVYPAEGEVAYRIEMFGDEVESLQLIHPTTAELLAEESTIFLFPAVHYVMPEDQLEAAVRGIREELDAQVDHFKGQGKLLEAQRIQARTKYDLEMIQEVGFCQGIENYSRHLDGRPPGAKPYTLLDYFPDSQRGEYHGEYAYRTPDHPGHEPPPQYADWRREQSDYEARLRMQEELGLGVPAWHEQGGREGERTRGGRSGLGAHGDTAASDWLMIIDESHVTLPQMHAMYHGDRHRKQTLVEHGFRLPSALDNRPLRFEEIEKSWPQVVFVSATPGKYEIEKSEGVVVEQVIRPTGLVDPPIEVRPADGQVPDVVAEVSRISLKRERSLVTTLTKRLAEDLSSYLADQGIKTRYLHSEIDTLDRVQVLRELREGQFDCLVGVNLLREGLDLPEVSFVGIMDADKEGYLRSATSLIQQIGRAARNANSAVILYADKITEAMRQAIDETERRREKQLAFNEAHGITPRTIKKAIRRGIELELRARKTARAALEGEANEKEYDRAELIGELEKLMYEAAQNLEFEKAAQLRDQVNEIKATPAMGKVKLSKKKTGRKPKPGTPGTRVQKRGKKGRKPAR